MPTIDIGEVKGKDGLGVPAGGAVGQVLAKKTDADNDTEWVDPPESSGGDSSTLNGKPAEYYTPYENRADNSNFREWVAQAGIGGAHGNATYGGDRWILDSGTITGTENTNGNGYSVITLNGTIRQIIANPEANMTAFVGMVSGTATVNYSYSDGVGELTITSAGGVLDWVMLLPGEWSALPPYVPKGYTEEYLNCRIYYKKISEPSSWVAISAIDGMGNIYKLPIDISMRITPTVETATLEIYDITSGWEELTFDLVQESGGYYYIYLKCETLDIETGKEHLVKGLIALNADL